MNTRRGIVVKTIGTAVAAFLTLTVTAGTADAAPRNSGVSVTMRDTTW